MNFSLRYSLLCCASLFSIVSATTINVPADYSTIQAALNVTQSGDTVLVQLGTYYENIFWPDVNGIKLISAGDSSNTVIDGGGISSVIYMNPSTATIDSTTEIRGFKITNGGNITNGGGMFVNNVSPVLTQLWVTGNTAYKGGGLYIESGNPTLTNVTVTGNTAPGGGGLYITGGSPTLTNVTVTGNTASSAGGGLYIYYNSSPTLMDVTVSGNIADIGGGIYITGGSPALTDVTVTGNTAAYYGGGLYIDGSPTLMTDVTVTDNTAGSGGGLYIVSSSPTLTGVIVTGNTAGSGGGLYIYSNSSPTLTGVTVSGNTATTGSGGGLYIYYNSSPTLMDVTVSGNIAVIGGGIWIKDGSPTLTNVTVTGNTATYGGGLCIYYSSNAMLTDVTVSGNTAGYRGGGLYIWGGSPTLTRTTVSRNLGEGLFFGGGSNGVLVNATITGNTSGIYVESGTPTIAGSNIAYHGAGLYNANNTNTIDADSVWWGDSTGPYHPQHNPGGLGDSVNAYVDITPFLTEPDTAAPPIPVQNLIVTNQGDDFIELAWDASPIGDLAGYCIYLDTDSSGFPYSNVIDLGNITSHTLTGLSPGDYYYIAVTCYDIDSNESWYSKEANTAPKDITAPSAPQNLMAEAGGGQVTLIWARSTESDFLRYRIYGGTTSNPTTAIDSTKSALDTTRTISGLDNGTTYYFRITAVDTAQNESDFSNEVSATPFNSLPGPFALLTPADGTTLTITSDNLDDSLLTSWETAADVDGDTVRYSLRLSDDLTILPTFSGITSTQVKLAHQEIVDSMTAADVLTAMGTWQIFATDGSDTTWASNGPFTLTIDASTLDIFRWALLPENFALHQNYPNPFNPASTIRYDLPEATSVRILVYDIMGREIVRLLDGYMEPGFHQVVWNGRDGTGRGVTTGIYITHLVTPEYTKSIKMLLLK